MKDLSDQRNSLKSANIKKRREVVLGMLNLGANTQNKERTAETSGIKSPVASLSDGDAEVRKCATGAMRNLLFNTQSTEKIAEVAGIRSFVFLLSDQDTEVRKKAADFLALRWRYGDPRRGRRGAMAAVTSK